MRPVAKSDAKIKVDPGRFVSGFKSKVKIYVDLGGSGFRIQVQEDFDMICSVFLHS